MLPLLCAALLSLCPGTLGYTELDSSTFKDFIADNEHSLVVFYAPWAEGWEKFEEHFEQIDEKMADMPVELGLVDIEENLELSVESGKNTLAIKFFFSDRVSHPPINYFDSFYAERVMAFLHTIMSSLVDTKIDGIQEIVDAFMTKAVSVAQLDKEVTAGHKAKIVALQEKTDVPEKKGMLGVHLRVMDDITSATGNLSKNLHMYKEKLSNHGHKMKIQEYIGLRTYVDVYEMYAESMLPPEARKVNQKKPKKVEAPPTRKVEVGADARQNILF
jgi:hypothetical protein